MCGFPSSSVSSRRLVLGGYVQARIDPAFRGCVRVLREVLPSNAIDSESLGTWSSAGRPGDYLGQSADNGRMRSVGRECCNFLRDRIDVDAQGPARMGGSMPESGEATAGGPYALSARRLRETHSHSRPPRRAELARGRVKALKRPSVGSPDERVRSRSSYAATVRPNFLRRLKVHGWPTKKTRVGRRAGECTDVALVIGRELKNL